MRPQPSAAAGRDTISPCLAINQYSRYAADRLAATALLRTVAHEQEERLKAMRWIETVVCRPFTRKRAVLVRELDLLRQEYDATWAELSDAFGYAIAERVKGIIERHAT